MVAKEMSIPPPLGEQVAVRGPCSVPQLVPENGILET